LCQYDGKLIILKIYVKAACKTLIWIISYQHIRNPIIAGSE
jgi:hypothetical protein